MKQKLFHLTLLLALINLLITAFLGVLLRVQPVVQIDGLVPRFVIHAHSHVAFLGWVFLALIAFIYKYWFFECRKVAFQYLVLLILFQTSVLGMLFSFPFTGYALWSIIFSSLHMAASLYFVVFFERKSLNCSPVAKQFVRLGLYFMALSSIGPLALGPLIATGHKMDMWYNLAIYFYLHFQYNGWFTMAIIGLIIHQLPQFAIDKNQRKIKRSIWLLSVGIVLSYLLSALGYPVSVWINILGGSGALVQLLGLYGLAGVFRSAVKVEFNSQLRSLLGLAIVILVSKAIAQLLSAFPEMVEFTYYNRDFIIAYLHWVLLGFVSLFLIYKIFRETSDISTGGSKVYSAWLFFIAFIVMELVLVFRALFLTGLSREFIYYLNEFLLVDALVLFVSVFMMLLSLFGYVKREVVEVQI